MAPPERVQKILAQAGIASRRKAEELIIDGLVTINGKLAQLGDKADLHKDAIKVKGKLLQRTKEPLIYLAFNKPRGVISMLADPEGRPTLANYLSKVHVRVFPVGRLDFNSEGLILLTNDGEFTDRLQKTPGIPRVYHVKVRGRPEPTQIAALERGARIANRLVKPHSVRMAEELASKVRIEIVFTEAGAIDVKALFDMKGFLVESIRRTAIGQITLRGTEPGHYRILRPSQVEALLAHPELGLRQLEPEQGRPDRATRAFGYRRPVAASKQLREKPSDPTITIIRPVSPSPPSAQKHSGQKYSVQKHSVQKHSEQRPSGQMRSGQKYSGQMRSGQKQPPPPRSALTKHRAPRRAESIRKGENQAGENRPRRVESANRGGSQTGENRPRRVAVPRPIRKTQSR